MVRKRGRTSVGKAINSQTALPEDLNGILLSKRVGLARSASWERQAGAIFPTDLPEELAKRIQQVAIDSFQALRLRDYGRIDLRVTPKEEIYVIEANPNCYLEQKSEFARAAQQSGLEYPALISRIVELASARYSR